VESALAFCKPNSLKELQSFLGVINIFKDHLRDHSTIAKPLFDMVALVIKHSTKLLTWTSEGQLAFEQRKALVNNCRKLYFVDYKLRYTDALDYALGAYLCQIRTLPDGNSIEEPVRFMGSPFHGTLLRKKLTQFTGRYFD
jgi:hypothetical protein